MDLQTQPLDLTALKTKGFQHVQGFLQPDVVADLNRRAAEVIGLRASGGMTTDSQDSAGLDYEWFKPLLLNPKILDLMTTILGPDVVCSGWRVLAKDRHYKQAVHVHQDWPYNPGDTNKVTVFLPLTRVNFENGGLIFLEESHYYGPVSRGPIDLSRIPPMEETCPDTAVGDIVLCDFLTWHYSLPKLNDDERLMIQLNYQPARDASNNNIVAGKLPHNKRLSNRLDAVSVPSVELNRVAAQGFFDAGDMDRAVRYARGLLFDDPDHAGAAMLLHDILARDNDPTALTYLEKARTSLNKMQAELAQRDARYGITAPVAAPAAAVVEEARPATPSTSTGPVWRNMMLTFKNLTEGHSDAETLPARLGTPALAWGYGAISEPIYTNSPASVRVRLRVSTGKVGVCLITEDCSDLASEQQVVTPAEGDAAVVIVFQPDKSPARILLRNYDDADQAGELTLNAVEMLDYR